jgi:C-terminal processing protease CtpA/Prc
MRGSLLFFRGKGDKNMRILIPLLLIFSISSCNVFLGPDPDNSPMAIFNSIWTDFDEKYALFDIKGINWKETRKKYSPQISPGMSDYELFEVCGNMLNTLNDPHVYLAAPFGHSYFLNYPDMDYYDLYYRDREPFPPFSISLIRDNYLDNMGVVAGDKRFLYGRIKLSKSSMRPIGYIYIIDFLDFNLGTDIIPDWAKEIDGIVKSLLDTDLLVLDIRNNNGGLGSNVNYIAGRFTSVQKDYIKSSTKSGPGRRDFTDPVTWTIKPDGIRYTKSIVLLTNRETVSAGEWFAAALRTQSHVTHVGETTRGAFSARVIRPLINGWEYTIAVQKVTNMAGDCLEGIGIIPHWEVKNSWDEIDIGNKDSQLEYALKLY